MAIVGDVQCLVQANNGHILAGTNDASRIFRSTDDGQTWAQVASFAANSSVTGLVRDNAGRLFASVTLQAAAQGVWRSLDNGANWTRVATNPATQNGYRDITVIRSNNRIIAVGYGSSSSAGNVISSSDGGNTWIACGVGLNNRVRTAHRVASSEIGSLAWFGFESMAPMLVLHNPGAGALSTNADYVPVAGKDIAVFNHRNAGGSNIETRLWAAQNGPNTEIWRFWTTHLTNFGSYLQQHWDKIATLSSVVFNAIYVDTTPIQTAQQRTIWAGADGAIWVSYNNGLTWALATDAPSGQIYAFVRTASGVLIAGGENGEIFRFGSGGSEGGGGDEDPPDEPDPPDPDPPDPDPPEEPEEPPEPEDPSVLTTRFLGRNATSEEGVHVANKFSFSNVTHIFYYNGADYINLQFGAEPPYSLLGAEPAVNKAAYFGSRTSDANLPGGTFSSLVFNISFAASDTTVVWEYYDGDSWEELDVQDNTNGFLVTGTNSVHWLIPSDWDTTAVNSITGYWVRARVSAVGDDPVGPVQSSRYIYTPNLPYVEMASSEIGGDLPALAQVLWRNRGEAETHRLLVGLRSHGRGPRFDAYLNLSDQQVPFGVTVTDLSDDGDFEDSLAAPTGRRYSVSYSEGGDLSAWANLVRISLSTTIARDYYGDFRVFLRGYITPGDADDWKFRLAIGVGSGGMVSYSKEVFGKPAQVDFRLFDMGSLHIPNAALSGSHISDELNLTVQGYATSTDVAAKLYDLILLPVDEWAGDFVHTNLSDAAVPSGVGEGDVLDVDSITNPKSPLNAYNRLGSGLIKAIYQPIANGEAVLQVGQRQRLWFVAAQYAFASNSWGAAPEVTGTVQVNKVQQYLGLRGAH